MDHSKKRIGLFLSSTVIFIIGFIVNITSDSSLYNVDLNIVPGWQSDAALGSKAFIGFMNVISNIFNPVVCAGYIALFWLISCKKLEVMVFLVWFIFFSWVLAVLKMAIQQSRPYWIQGSGVQMLEWTCYSQFGCPSGHSMLGLILMEFIIRFFMRSYKAARRLSWLLYIILVILQLLVMFSRVILGMHTFNEVLMGAMIGLYSISAYYLYMEALIVKYFDHLIHTNNKRYQFLIVLTAIFGTFLIDILVAYVPKYNFQDTFDYIVKISGCEKIKEYKSFQYKCFEDSSILMASFGLIVGLTYMKNPENLTKPLAYTRCSGKFAGKLGIMILLAAVPAVIFLNPFWGDIPAANPYLALIIWICQCFGFFLAVLMLLLVSPIVCFRLGLQEYTTSEYVELSRAIAENNEQMELSSNKECL